VRLSHSAIARSARSPAGSFNRSVRGLDGIRASSHGPGGGSRLRRACLPGLPSDVRASAAVPSASCPRASPSVGTGSFRPASRFGCSS
jgi:hypothetical protein